MVWRSQWRGVPDDGVPDGGLPDGGVPSSAARPAGTPCERLAADELVRGHVRVQLARGDLPHPVLEQRPAAERLGWFVGEYAHPQLLPPLFFDHAAITVI